VLLFEITHTEVFKKKSSTMLAIHPEILQKKLNRCGGVGGGEQKDRKTMMRQR
jgi:hypothetical protein